MNPPIYRITGVDPDGNRKLLYTNNGWSIYTEHSAAKSALSQLNGWHGRFHARYLTDLRIDAATPDWRPAG